MTQICATLVINHNIAKPDKGDVFGWGNSEYGQLNSVTDEMQLHTSRRLAFPGMKRVVDVAAGGTMCLLLDGEDTLMDICFLSVYYRPLVIVLMECLCVIFLPRGWPSVQLGFWSHRQGAKCNAFQGPNNNTVHTLWLH